MTPPLTLALRIAQLIQEHSEKDIRAAIAILEAHGIGSPLLDFVARRRTGLRAPGLKANSGSARISLKDTTSRAVLQLRDTDPDKFHLLSEFDQMVRRGQVLGTLEDLKRFGQRISKDFRARKSRKETIGPLLSILAERPLPELEKLVEFAASLGVAGDMD